MHALDEWVMLALASTGTLAGARLTWFFGLRGGPIFRALRTFFATVALTYLWMTTVELVRLFAPATPVTPWRLAAMTFRLVVVFALGHLVWRLRPAARWPL